MYYRDEMIKYLAKTRKDIVRIEQLEEYDSDTKANECLFEWLIDILKEQDDYTKVVRKFIKKIQKRW